MLNHRMIQIGRELRGLTQSQLAKLSGFSPARLSRLENCLVEPSNDEIQTIASSLDLPPSFFERPSSGTSFDLNFRKRSGLPVRQRERLIATLHHLHYGINAMFRGVDLVPPFDLAQLRRVINKDNPEEAAQQVRVCIGNEDAPIASIAEVIEAFGIIVFPINLTDTLGESFMQFDGATVRWSLIGRSSGVGVTRDVIFINALHSGERQRFTLAHELAHAVLHIVPSESAEQEANDFASELLIPRRQVQRIPSSIRVEGLLPNKRYWRLSVKALLRAMFRTRVVDSGRYKSLSVRYSQLGWQQGEPDPLVADRPYLIDSVVRHYMITLGYTPAELQKMVGIVPGKGDWQRWYGIDLDQFMHRPQTKVLHLR